MVAVADLRDDLRALHEVRSDRARRSAVVQVPTPAVKSAPAKPKTVKAHAPKRAVKKAPARKAKARSTRKRATSAPVTYSGSGSVSTVIQFALSKVGMPYVWGAAGPRAYDCSGLIMAAYARIGVHLPHQSGAMAGRGRYVPAGQWRPGDILVYAGHVALYIGGGMMVEAANPRADIRVTKVRSASARRLIG